MRVEKASKIFILSMCLHSSKVSSRYRIGCVGCVWRKLVVEENVHIICEQKIALQIAKNRYKSMISYHPIY